MNIVYGQYSTNEIPLGQALKERNVTLSAYMRNSLCIVGKGYISQNKERGGNLNKQEQPNEGKILTTDLWSSVYHQQVFQQSKLDLIYKEQQRQKRNQHCLTYIRNSNSPNILATQRTEKIQVSPKGTPFSNKRQKTQDSLLTRPSTQQYGQDSRKGIQFDRKALMGNIITEISEVQQPSSTMNKKATSPRLQHVNSLQRQNCLFDTRISNQSQLRTALKSQKMKSEDFLLPLQSIIDDCDDQLTEKKGNKTQKASLVSLYKKMLF